jgi:hypothetical protein
VIIPIASRQHLAIPFFAAAIPANFTMDRKKKTGAAPAAVPVFYTLPKTISPPIYRPSI